MPAPHAPTGWRRTLAACALGAGAVTMSAAAASAAPVTPGGSGAAPAAGDVSTAVFQTSQCTATAQTMGLDLTNLSTVAHTYSITTSSGAATPAGAQLQPGGHTYLQVSVPRTARGVFVYSSGRLVGSLALNGCATSGSSTTAAPTSSAPVPTASSAPSALPTATLPRASRRPSTTAPSMTSDPTPTSSATSSTSSTTPTSTTSTTTSAPEAPSSAVSTPISTSDDAKDSGSSSLMKGLGIGVAVLGIALAGTVLFREFKK